MRQTGAAAAAQAAGPQTAAAAQAEGPHCGSGAATVVSGADAAEARGCVAAVVVGSTRAASRGGSAMPCPLPSAAWNE